MSSQQGYKIRTYVNGAAKTGKEWKNFSITVPSEIADQIPEGLRFVPRMCSKEEDGVDGLLYEPVSEAKSNVKKPAWLKEKDDSGKVADLKSRREQS